MLNTNKRSTILAEWLVAGETISDPNQAIKDADAVSDVIEVGGIEEDERSSWEEEELRNIKEYVNFPPMVENLDFV